MINIVFILVIENKHDENFILVTENKHDENWGIYLSQSFLICD